MATATWPGLTFLELPSRAAGSRSLVSARSTAMSVSGSRPSTRADTRRPSVERQLDGGRAFHDVIVGQHEAVGRQNAARPGALRRPALAPLPRTCT